MIFRLTKRQLIGCAALGALAGLHLCSLCVLVRYYGASFVLEFGQGFAVVYWGGDEELRNSGVYNAGEWPLRPETHFAGGHLPEGQRWEAYGPHLELDRQWFSERIQYSGLLGALGLSVPQYRSEEDAASALLPVGTVAVTAQAAALVLLLKPNKGAPPNGGPA
jgi:hypothetical protein